MAESATVSDLIGQKAGRLRSLKDEIDALEEQVNKKKAEAKQIAEHDLPQLMERAEIEKVKFQGIGTVYLKTEPKASVLVADQERFHQWLDDNGHGDIIKRTVHHQTLNTWAKEILENGLPVPEFVKVYYQTKAVIRKG